MYDLHQKFYTIKNLFAYLIQKTGLKLRFLYKTYIKIQFEKK